MTTKLIAVPEQDVQQKDVRQQDVPKQDVHKQDVPNLNQVERWQVEPAECLAVFPEYPPRDDMQNSLYLNRFAHVTALEVHLGNPDTTLVLGEVSVAPTAALSKEHRRPDLIVSFNCDPELVIRQKGYAIVTQGKPPDFVLEVASSTTGIIDFTEKRIDYAAYGIPEYWRYDQTGGRYHDAALAGDKLVDGKYEPIEIKAPDAMSRYGYSEALDLYVCWEYGRLRWYDHHTGKYLMTFFEEREFRLQETARADQEAFAREQAETRAEDAETRAAQEAIARQQEARARQQEARARQQAEAEIQRLRAQLDALKRPDND